MLKKTITYEDFDGNQRTEDFYFNLNRSEMIEMDLSTPGGYEKQVNKIIAEQNHAKLVEYFKEMILKSYGEKDLEGKRFVKSDTISLAFSQTNAYDQLFIELATDANAAADFINGVLPKDNTLQDHKDPKKV
jgi:hypothetical protein